MKAEIISIGTELLLGTIVNTNASYLARKLSEIGIDLYYQTTVGDNPQRLSESVNRSLNRSDIVVLTGGLGPTVDDITVETLSRLVGRKLILNRTVLSDIKAHFTARGFKPPAGNERQAYIPEGSRCIRNAVGTAPGIILEHRGKVIVCLPGPPRELHPVFERGVLPYLKRRFASGFIFKTRTVRTTGLPESRVNLIVRDLLKLPPPTTVGIYASLSEVDLVIMAKAKSETAARRAIAPLEKKIRARLAEYIFGLDDETLEGVVGSLLTKKRLTLSIAESCTGGLIAKRITDVAGSSGYFKAGIVTYSNESKESFLGVKAATLRRCGAVSRSVALEMARGIKHFACADIGIGVTGVAGPAGGTKAKPVGLVYIAYATDTKRLVKEYRFKGSRQDVRFQASQAALDLIRRTT